MEWQIFALLQMALITIGVSVAFGLHNRKLSSQNHALRQHLEQLQAQSAAAEAAPPAAETVVAQALDRLAADDPCQGLISAILHNALDPRDDFNEKLPELIAHTGLGTVSDSTADVSALQLQIAELEAQLAAGTEGAAPGTVSAAEDSADAEELKTLLQQFTHDSREMMACIQELEHENAALKAQLGGDSTADSTTDAEVPQAAEVPATEAEVDAEPAATEARETASAADDAA